MRASTSATPYFHYDRKNPQPPHTTATQRKALEQAASVILRGPNFRNLSAETLGAFYDESRISKLTLDVLNTHRTPTHLVDYMLAKLSPWIEDLGAEQCRIFEPACGHAPFLSGALRLLSDILPPRIAADPAARNQLLRKNLSGCDHDPGALEIARLSLTLAGPWTQGPSTLVAIGLRDLVDTAALNHEIRSTIVTQ